MRSYPCARVFIPDFNYSLVLLSEMAHKKQGYRFENDWPPEHQEYLFQSYKTAITIPVNVEIEAEHHVLNMENVKRILSNARTISVMGVVAGGYLNTATPLSTSV